MTIIRPSSKTITNGANGAGQLEFIWDYFFNLMQQAVNNIQTPKGFTATAGASTVVTDNRITATSFVALAPTNSAAATLQSGASMLYFSATDTVAGVSFAVKTTSGSAAGTETFRYIIIG